MCLNILFNNSFITALMGWRVLIPSINPTLFISQNLSWILS